MGLLMRYVVVLAVATVSCADDLSIDLSRIDGPRVLAVAAMPAEAAPDATVRMHALLVDADGERPGAAPQWSLCTTRRGLAEVGPVADVCIDRAPEAIAELGFATAIDVQLTADACRLFGPDPPPALPGEAQGRPVEPDHTGGYYQPVLVVADDELAVHGVRLVCGIAGATQAQAAELRRRHRPNVAPRIASLAIDGDLEADLGGVGPSRIVHVAPGAIVDLVAQWPSCPRTPSCGDLACTLDEDAETCPSECIEGAGCDGAEWYARFDPLALEIVEARESIAVAWYATRGRLDVARTGRAADDDANASDNVWTAPDEPGPATVWIVVRDDRGGVSWRTVEVVVGE